MVTKPGRCELNSSSYFCAYIVIFSQICAFTCSISPGSSRSYNQHLLSNCTHLESRNRILLTNRANRLSFAAPGTTAEIHKRTVKQKLRACIVTELRSHVTLDVISDTFYPANLLVSTEEFECLYLQQLAIMTTHTKSVT